MPESFIRLEARSLERIAEDFPAAEQVAAVELLGGYADPEPARVVWYILLLSKGSVENANRYLQYAKTDYRDVLYWAEYYDTDPMVQGRDARQAVADILKNFGDKK